MWIQIHLWNGMTIFKKQIFWIGLQISRMTMLKMKMQQMKLNCGFLETRMWSLSSAWEKWRHWI